MVRKLSLLVLLLIAVLTAAVVGCSFFAASLFPSYLTQISASIDLSKEMNPFIGSAGEDFECRLYVLKNSSDREYIFVGIHVFSPDKKKVIILDNSLKVRKELEDPQLGELHMVDANGDFLIGNVLFSQVDLTLMASPGVDPYRQGASDGTYNFIMWIDSGSPDELQYRIYDNAWSGGAIQNPLIGTGVFSLENTGYSAAKNEVALFLHRQGDDFSQVVLIPADHFWTGLTPPTIISSYTVFPVDSANHENYHYTRDGIVVNTHDGVAKLYGFDGKVKAEFPIGNDSDAVEAYDTEGSCYYHLDVQGRRLYKCGTWW
jgi:hypothetical protein